MLPSSPAGLVNELPNLALKAAPQTPLCGWYDSAKDLQQLTSIDKRYTHAMAPISHFLAQTGHVIVISSDIPVFIAELGWSGINSS